MSEEFYTVEDAATRLRLHVKTLRRFIREGRLKATRVGKAYLIQRSAFDAFAGLHPTLPASVDVRVTSIVDLSGIDAERARRLASFLPSARLGAEPHADPMSFDVIHDAARRHLKIVIAGSLADVSAMQQLIEFHLAQKS
jgi:excisionase family DNA binding protein